MNEFCVRIKPAARFEQVYRPFAVDINVGNRLAHRLGMRRVAGTVEDDVLSANASADRLKIANIVRHDLDFVFNVAYISAYLCALSGKSFFLRDSW